MAAMQAGDREAGRDLLKAAWALSTVTAGRILTRSGVRDQSMVEDIAQETLLAVYDKRHTYDPALPFVPWLAAITRYKAIDRLRRSQWHRTDSLDDRHEHLTAHSVPPETALELERLLVTLPPRARRALELVKLAGLSHAEAAAELGVKEGALKVIVHRALQRLKQERR